jgi:hypothetical protein
MNKLSTQLKKFIANNKEKINAHYKEARLNTMSVEGILFTGKVNKK